MALGLVASIEGFILDGRFDLKRFAAERDSGAAMFKSSENLRSAEIGRGERRNLIPSQNATSLHWVV